jgi:glucose/arabinose dehydrogenase
MTKSFICCLFLIAIGTSVFAQKTISEGFFDQPVSNGMTLPVGIVFDHNGNGYIWEKSGKVFFLDPNTKDKSLVLDISEEVGSWGDHGLTGFALDPEFEDNGYVYMAYTVDRYYLFNSESPNYNPDSTIIKNATIARVVRYNADPNSYPVTIDKASQKILVGTSLTDGFPILADFHGVGSLAFGKDGSLLVGCGDGGLDNEPNVDYHTEQALKDGIIDSTMILGSYRAQSLHSLNGKLIRIDKATGDGLPSNPFYEEADPRSPKSRIWSLGFRNPYKFIHLPGTGAHNINLGQPGKFIIGDVGSSYWEEFNLMEEKGANFGWPLYEGHHGAWPYGFYDIENPFAPNPDYGTEGCDRKFLLFKDLVAQDNQENTHQFFNPCSSTAGPIPEEYPTFIHKRPFLYYNNVQWNQPTRSFIPGYDVDGIAIEVGTDSMGITPSIEGYSAIPGTWYETGSFPDSFSNSLIISDFSGWIRALEFDENYEVKKIRELRSDIKGVVNVTLNEIDDCLYYVHILTGEVRKICFGGNPPPVAIATADTTYGPGNLVVQFDASQSYDPNQLPIEVEWDFGDGKKSNEMNPTHEFQAQSTSPERFTVMLTVTDSLGALAQDSLDISLNNSPPKVKIISPSSGDSYAVNGYNRLDFEAEVIDAEESSDMLQYKWQIHLHHNLHYHSEEPISKQSFNSLIEPVGCGETDVFWYRISLEVNDSYGLNGKDEVLIYPNCSEYTEVEWRLFEGTPNSLILNYELERPEMSKRIVVQRFDDAGNILDLGEGKTSSFEDTNPILGTNRYRLKIYTSEHDYFYSSENAIEFPLFDDVKIYPNPALTESISVELSQSLEQGIEISLYSIDGIKLKEKRIDSPAKNRFKTSFQLGDLTNGVYILQIRNGDRIFQERLEVLK